MLVSDPESTGKIDKKDGGKKYEIIIFLLKRLNAMFE